VSLLYRVLRWIGLAALVAGASAMLAACGQVESGGIAPAALPVSKAAVQLMSQKGMTTGSPIFVRIFKEESELEVWKARDDGHYYHFKTYPICNWSGDLGPKLETGDRQAPEGFYNISAGQMNPNSDYYLSFNVGFPNAYDKAYGRTGSAIMVHGNCKSAGCYAMTDALVEEIYALVREAIGGGQKQIPLHAFPFRMSPENMKKHQGNQWFAFWKQLKQGYDYFETTRQPPSVAVCSKQYVVNAKFGEGAVLEASAPCPAFTRPKPQLFVDWEQPNAETLLRQAKAPGIKTRHLAAEQAFTDAKATEGGWNPESQGGKPRLSPAAMGFNNAN
jgi:murein L,D-transpeptidase YafK